MASLPWLDICKLWKDYMVIMAECLVDAAGEVSSPQGQRLARLVYETGVPLCPINSPYCAACL